jgi:hypothetical protein
LEENRKKKEQQLKQQEEQSKVYEAESKWTFKKKEAPAPTISLGKKE